MDVKLARGQVWWADLDEPGGSEPGFRRPVVVVQADAFNRSAIRTAVIVAVSANLKLAQAPGNVLLPARATGLKKDSVANVSQIATLDRERLTKFVASLSPRLLAQIEDGLRLVLDIL